MRIALPIEVKLRDLRGTVWLALHLVERGHEVVLGETASIRYGLDAIEPDVYVRTGLSEDKKKINNTRVIHNSGGSVVVIDTEGGVFFNDQAFKENRIISDMVDYINTYFSWGERPSELFAETIDDQSVETVTSGHPRFDLLSEDLREVYRNKSRDYEKKYGDYVLINTNFSRANNATKSSSNFDSDQVAYQSDLLSEYINAIKRLSDEIEINIIVRPHPIEDLSPYKHHLSDSDNLNIVRDGNVRPWLLGANAVVHKSSTTGIESVLLDTPTISYLPIKNDKYDSELPIHVSEVCSSYRELYQCLSHSIDIESYSLTRTQEKKLKSYFYNMNKPIAAKIISDRISSLPESAEVELDELKPPIMEKIKRLGVQLFGKNLVEDVGEQFFGTDRSGVRQKFPGLSQSELRSEIIALSEASNQDLPKTNISKISYLSNTFIIRSEYTV